MKLKVDFCRYDGCFNEPVYAIYIKKGWFWRKVVESGLLTELMKKKQEIIDCGLGEETEL